VNEFKVGRVVPGAHIPVVDERTLDKQPDYYLVLCWNFALFLREKYGDYLRNGGRFIVPVPKVQIMSHDSVWEPQKRVHRGRDRLG